MPESLKFKQVGTLKSTPWERFNRLQQTAALLLGNRRHPGGVFRFKTHEEFEAWKTKVSLQPAAPPTKTISSASAAS